MAITRTAITLNPDGSLRDAAPLPLALVPGVDATWTCYATSADGGSIVPTDLTGAILAMVMTNSLGAIALLYETTLATVLDGPNGIFQLRWAADVTRSLPPGTYTIEVKAALVDGTLVRLALLTGVSVLATAFPGTP